MIQLKFNDDESTSSLYLVWLYIKLRKITLHENTKRKFAP